MIVVSQALHLIQLWKTAAQVEQICWGCTNTVVGTLISLENS